MASAIHDKNGIRFEYPEGWDVDISEDGPRTSVTVQSTTGPAFAMVTVDESRPPVQEMVDEALAAVREEYPELDSSQEFESINGHQATGHDIEFISLDMTNNAVIRAYQTPRRTVFLLCQWSDLEDDEPEAVFNRLRKSLEETDA